MSWRREGSGLKKDRVLLIALVLFGTALGVRWVAMLENQVIARDAILYIKAAKLYAVGDYAGGFNAFPRSIFPLFIVFAQRIFGDWVRAGQWVSTFFGALAVIPLYLLARRIFNEKIALISAIFYVVCPSLVKDSAEVLREMPFLFFYTTALWLGYEGIRGKSLWAMGLAGVSVLLCASLKDYGLMLFVSLLLFLCWFLVKRQITMGKALILCSTFLASAMIALTLFGIVLDYKRYNMHASIVSRAKGALAGITHHRAAMSGLEDEIERLELSTQGKRLLGLAIDHRFALYFFNIISKTVHAFNIILFIFFIFGLIKRYIVPYRFDEFLLFTIYVAYIPLFFLLLNFANYLQTKNTFPLLVPSLIWSGVGFEEFTERATHWLQKRSLLFKKWDIQRTGLLMLILVTIAMLFVNWVPHRQDKLWHKEVGIWLRNHGYAHSIMVGQEELDRLAFYADSEFIPLPKGSYEEIMKFAREKKASLLVLDKKAADRLPLNFFDRISPKDLQPVDITGIKTLKYATIILSVVNQK